MVSHENLNEYDKNGYFFIKGLFSIEELQPLIKESGTFSSHPSKFSVKDAKGNPAHLISWTHLANDFIGVLKGKGFIEEGVLIKDPMDFSKKNYASLSALDQILKRLIFPNQSPKQEVFDLNSEDYEFIRFILYIFFR